MRECSADLSNVDPRTVPLLRLLRGRRGVTTGVVVGASALALLGGGGWMLMQDERFPYWLSFTTMSLGLMLAAYVYTVARIARILRDANSGPS